MGPLLNSVPLDQPGSPRGLPGEDDLTVEESQLARLRQDGGKYHRAWEIGVQKPAGRTEHGVDRAWRTE